MNTKRLDAAEVLRKLSALREMMPRPEGKFTPTTEVTLSPSGDAMADFEEQAVVDALGSMADELHAAIEEKREKLFRDSMEIYYTAEELARDPAHAHVIPHVEAMRAAYEKDFGHPIPPRNGKKTGT
jgi:hypothetical protein